MGGTPRAQQIGILIGALTSALVIGVTLKETADLNATFTRIAQELHSQYVLGFSPTLLDGKVHKLTVNVKRPGLKARERKSYVASSDGAPGRVK